MQSNEIKSQCVSEQGKIKDKNYNLLLIQYEIRERDILDVLALGSTYG